MKDADERYAWREELSVEGHSDRDTVWRRHMTGSRRAVVETIGDKARFTLSALTGTAMRLSSRRFDTTAEAVVAADEAALALWGERPAVVAIAMSGARTGLLGRQRSLRPFIDFVLDRGAEAVEEGLRDGTLRRLQRVETTMIGIADRIHINTGPFPDGTGEGATRRSVRLRYVGEHRDDGIDWFAVDADGAQAGVMGGRLFRVVLQEVPEDAVGPIDEEADDAI